MPSGLGIPAQPGQTRRKLRVRAASKQGREQRVLLRTSRINLVDASTDLSLKRSGRSTRARHARGTLYRKHALRGYAIPIGNRWLRDPDAPREFADAAYGADRFLVAPGPASACFWALLAFSS